MSGQARTRLRRLQQLIPAVGAAAFLVCLALCAPARAMGECEFYSYKRNQIYKDAGYCFKTSEQIAIFGNAGCQYDDVNDVPLSARQRQTVSSIVRQERASGCR